MQELNLPIAWRPDDAVVEQANITAQMRKYRIPNYEAFLQKSIDAPDWFWRAFFEDIGFHWHTPYQQTVDLSGGKPFAKWFVGGKLNWTYNALERHVLSGRGDALALVWEGEEGTMRRYTYAELLREVNALARGLLKWGVQPGDRVGLFLPLIPETAIALLAISRIGAIALPLFSGFGVEPIVTRMQDAEARWLFIADGFPRRGKLTPAKETAYAALRELPFVQRVFTVERTQRDVRFDPALEVRYTDLLDYGKYEAPAFDSETPCMMIYTSGTTGKPKAAFHAHAGFPIKAAQDMYHLFDLKPSDTISWLTDIGWMMGPWLIMGGLIMGATVFMYDGAPDYPAPDRVWEMVERHNISVLGITPTLIRALMRESSDYADRHAMPSLRLIGSTGEPWNPEPWLWTLQHVGKHRAPIINYSGGTEISGGILGCTVLRPLKPCSFNTVAPGVDAVVLNEQGEPVRGEVGLLCVRNVNPGMTRGFWRDPERYLETYWSRFENLWYHGDLSLIDADGFWYILGRADDTLKIAGKRVGPAEIESVLVEHPSVSEAGVIGVPDEIKGQEAIAFVVLKPGTVWSDALAQELLNLVAERMGKPLKPKAVYAVPDLPKTRNAKIMRRVIRAAYLGEPTGDLSALENPQSIEAIAQLRS